MQELYEHIKQFTGLSPSDFNNISPYFELKHVNKKENLYSPNDQILRHYFVLEGCVHMYFY